LDIDKGLCASFRDGQKEFDVVNKKKFADPKENWYRLARKKIDLQAVYGSKFKLNLEQGEQEV
jgi:hypothetical protein